MIAEFPDLKPDREDPTPSFGDEVVELGLLLTAQQARLVEELAHRRGETVGQFLRRAILRFLDKSTQDSRAEW